MTKNTILTTCCLLFIISSVHSECSNEDLGKEYLMAFMDMNSSISKEEVMFSAPTGGTIRLHVPSYTTEIDSSHTLQAKEQKSDVYTGVRLEGTGKAHVVFKLSSADVFAAFGMNIGTVGCDGYWALPTDRLGREYYSVHHYPPRLGGELAIAAGSQGARVAVYAGADRTTPLNIGDAESAPARGRLFVDLGPHEAIQIQSQDRLSGTRIYANKPVAVFSGNIRVTVNNAGTEGLDSHLVEQLVPASQWGTVFYVIPFPDREFMSIWLVASHQGADVAIYGVPGVGTYRFKLNETKPAKLFVSINGYYTINSSNPIQVIHVADSKVNQSSTHSPLSAMSIVPSTSQFKKEYYFALPVGPQEKPFQHFLLLVIDTSKKSGLRLDDNVVDQSGWEVFSNDEGSMSGKRLSVADGTHWLKHPDTAFGVVLYGSSGSTCTYAMPAGLCLHKNPDAELSTDFPEVNVKNINAKGIPDHTTTTTTTTTKAPSPVSKNDVAGAGDATSTITTTSKGGKINKPLLTVLLTLFLYTVCL